MFCIKCGKRIPDNAGMTCSVCLSAERKKKEAPHKAKMDSMEKNKEISRNSLKTPKQSYTYNSEVHSNKAGINLSVSISDKVICPRCRMELTSSDAYCKRCGYDMARRSGNTVVASSMFNYAIMIIAVVAIILNFMPFLSVRSILGERAEYSNIKLVETLIFDAETKEDVYIGYSCIFSVGCVIAAGIVALVTVHNSGGGSYIACAVLGILQSFFMYRAKEKLDGIIDRTWYASRPIWSTWYTIYILLGLGILVCSIVGYLAKRRSS